MSIPVRLALLAGAAAVVTAALVPLARLVALAYGVVDRPAPGKAHRSATPYLGGVAIALVAVGGTSLAPGWRTEAGVIAVAATAVGAVGLLDDIFTLRPAPRVLVEAVAATAVFLAGARVEVAGDALDWLLTVVWLVVLTNAFNLLDNLDGCASAVGAATGSCLVVAAALEGQQLVGSMAALVTGACAGFLVHNRPPAKVFMGDAGSLFCGFLLATTALKLRWPAGHGAGLAAVVLLTGVALFDTGLVVVSRLRAGRPFYVGGTDHTSHRLVLLGMPRPLVPVVLAVAATGGGLVGVATGRGVLPVAAAVGPLAVAALAALWALLRVPVYGTSPARTGAVRAATQGS